jgi:hypothetical protein
MTLIEFKTPRKADFKKCCTFIAALCEGAYVQVGLYQSIAIGCLILPLTLHFFKNALCVGRFDHHRKARCCHVNPLGDF